MHINVMDIETFDNFGEIIPYCICVKYLNILYHFWYDNDIVTAFLEKIVFLSNGSETTLYTHNINFDGLIILNAIKNKNIIYDMFIRNNSIYWIKINYLKTTITIRCSYKLIPLSIKNLGMMTKNYKSIFPYKFVNKDNLNYIGPVPDISYFNNIEDFHLFSNNNTIFNLKEKTIEYCIQDIEIVHEVLVNIIRIINSFDKKIINKTFSFSSLAYKIYIKKFDKWKIEITKNNLFEHEYFKNAYYGGRCEVFGNPEDDKIIHYFDFTGMYSQCMTQLFPIKKPTLKTKNLDINNIGFHTIKFKCNDYLPFLPIRSNKLIFPNGILTGTYWYEEIIHAIKYNKCEILDHYSSYIYDDVDYIFKDYINFFTTLRKKGLYYNLFGKNMNNGLYGSFALNDSNEIYIICLNESELNSYKLLTDIKKITKVGNSYILNIIMNEKSRKIIDKKNIWDLKHKKRNIAYAAIIASKARIKLNTALQDVINSGGDLYYTDTDSIYAGYCDSKLGFKLGEITWSNTYSEGVFISSKFYFIKNEKIKLKGINNSEYDYEFIKKVFYNDSVNIVFKDQLHFEHKNFELKQKYLEKEISFGNYEKRIFDKYKKKTKPITIYPDF